HNFAIITQHRPLNGGSAMTRAVHATVLMMSLIRVGAEAQSSDTSGHGATAAPPTVVVGCLARTDQGFLLTSSQAAVGARTAGSTSAKASTPVGHGATEYASSRTGGSTSAKASTPIGTTQTTSDAPRTGVVMTAKASVPIAAAIRGPHEYVLHATDPLQLI